MISHISLKNKIANLKKWLNQPDMYAERVPLEDYATQARKYDLHFIPPCKMTGNLNIKSIHLNSAP